MKNTILIILIGLCFPLFGQRTITEKAIFNYTPLDKVWFTQRVGHYNDTSYFMEVELDSKVLNEAKSVVLHFADGDCVILDPIITIDKGKYVVTYFYQAQIKMNEFLINKMLSSLLVGYSINYQKEKLSSADSKKYLKLFKGLCK